MPVHCAKCGGERVERHQPRTIQYWCPVCRNTTRPAGILDPTLPDPAIGARDRLRAFLRSVTTEQLVEGARRLGEQV